MLRILLLCLFGLSSISFSAVLEQIFLQKTINQDEFQQQLKNAEQYVIPDDIKKIIQDSFNTHQKDLEKLDLPHNTLQDILNSLCQHIILCSVDSPQKVSPLGLVCALMKEAETALNEERFTLARFDTLLITFIAKGGLGSQSVQMTEGENIESIDQIATITPLCHTYSILGLIKKKQIKNGNNKKFVDICPLSYEIIDDIVYELIGKNRKIFVNSKQYIESFYELRGIKYQNIFNTDKEYTSLSDYKLENKIRYSLFIPQLFTIYNNNLFDKEEYLKNQEIYSEYVYTDFESLQNNLNINTNDQIEFEELLNNEEWYNIAQKPPISINTRLTQKYLQNKIKESNNYLYSYIINILTKHKESYTENPTNDLNIAQQYQSLSEKLVNIKKTSSNADLNICKLLEKLLALITSSNLFETPASELLQDLKQQYFQQQLKELALYWLCFNKIYSHYTEFLIDLASSNSEQNNSDKTWILKDIGTLIALGFQLETFIDDLYDYYDNKEEVEQETIFKTQEEIFRHYSLNYLNKEKDILEQTLDSLQENFTSNSQ